MTWATGAWPERGRSAAGFYAGPVAWFLNTEINYALVPWTCAHGVRIVPVIALVAASIAIAGGLLSWRAWRTTDPVPSVEDPSSARPHRFLAGLGVLASALFTAVILLQGVASLVFQGCER